MAATTRKAIAAALLAELNVNGIFTLTGRRDRAPEQAASPNKPGLFLLKPREEYKYAGGNESRGIPPTRELLFVAIIYTDYSTIPTAVPADGIDDLIDAIELALLPNAVTGRQTLGGTVYDCRIEGEIEFAPGDNQGKGETAVPIKVIWNDSTADEG